MFFFTEENGLIEVLNTLIERFEYELVEFKEASNDYKQDEIGKYFSAISNEANLKGQQYGWLVFGVRNKDRAIVGSEYRNTKGLDTLKQEISDNTTGAMTFIDVFEVYPIVDNEPKRVIMFKIPAAVTSIPTGWKNHYYGRAGESLGPLSLEELDRIRGQKRIDWSKQILENAGIEYLDKAAVALAREKYKEKNKNKEHIIAEVDAMSDLEFLTKLKLIVGGKLTNAALLLLGNSDYDNLFHAAPQIMWRLYSEKGEDKDYEIFTIPYLTVVDKVFNKLRNLTYRYMPNQLTLFPLETEQYDPLLVRELINNCIAHQDYTIGGRIYVNEFEDSRLKITNPGSFLPKTVEVVLAPSYSPPYYKNQLLAEVMAKINMIDTAAMGIRRIFNIQRNKFFPLPDYDLKESGIVSVTVYGKVLDINYTRLLHDNQNLDLDTVFLLDKVQKGVAISKEDTARLRKLNLVEGKYPKLFVSAKIAEIVDEKAQYTKNKAFDDKYYKDLILKFLKQFKKASKQEINNLVSSKLPDVLSEKQKQDKVRNILQAMRKEGLIDTDSDNRRLANWILKQKS